MNDLNMNEQNTKEHGSLQYGFTGVQEALDHNTYITHLKLKHFPFFAHFFSNFCCIYINFEEPSFLCLMNKISCT